MQRRDCLRTLAALATLGVAGRMPGLASADDATVKHHVRDLQRGKWLTAGELLARLMSTSALVIGEQHDNSEHHRLERWLIRRLAERNALGGVAMEMLNDEQQTRLERLPGALLAELSDDELQEALAWQAGWDWSAYGPTLRQALRLGVPVSGANLSRARLSEIVSANNRAPDLPAPVARAQRQALVDGHCGMLPEAMLDGVLAAQVARDRAMAAALAELPPISVLICGNGHARRDIGAALHAEDKPLCLGLVELSPDQDWTSALPASVDEGPPFDLAWFTPPVAERGDYCTALRERFSS